MTAGNSLLKNLSWPLKTKKRERSGSGGSWDLDKKKKSQQRKLTGWKESGGSSLEICAPATSDVEFKYSWPIDNFITQVKSCKGEGLDSKPFEVNVNGVLTTWSLSVRFWVGENNERLANPFVLCLNLVSCKVERKQDVTIKYKFGIFNRVTEEAEMGAPDRVSLSLETAEKLQSVGYKNIAMNEKHVTPAGDIQLLVRLSIIRQEEVIHSLSSDLGNLINDEKSSDLILEAGERKFMVHRNILSARSPVFASLLAQLENNMDRKTTDKLENIQEDQLKEDDPGEEPTSQTAGPCARREEEEEETPFQPTADTSHRTQPTAPSPEEPAGEPTKPSGAGTEPSEPSSNPPVEPEKEKEKRANEGTEGDNETEAKQTKGDRERNVKRLVINDLPGDTVEELLRYIYTDSSNNVELFSQTLLAASDRYKLPGLKLHCEKHLGEIINPLNVADILLLSENYSCRDLKRVALAYCGENHSYIMKDTKWKTIEKERPDLFEEAIAHVAPDTCHSHAECLKKGGNRYEAEKNSGSSLRDSGFGRRKSHVRKI